MKLNKSMIALALLSGVTMVGCTNKEEVFVEQQEEKVVSVQDVKSGLLESGLLVKGGGETIDAKEHWVFEEVKDVIEEGFVSQALINVNLEDVFFVKTTDMDKVEEALLKYKEESLRLFGDGYGGEDNAKAVAESKLVKENGYVYFVATANANEVDAKIQELMK